MAQTKPCHGSFSAQQVKSAVLIFAVGSHPTAGFEVGLVRSPIEVYPPEFQLRHAPPSGPTAQVITPFAVFNLFSAEERVDSVIVHDAAGRHEVEVEQVLDRASH